MKPASVSPSPPSISPSTRLNAFLASAGLGSRRSTEKLILEGRVSINGHTVRELFSRVDPVSDRVTCDGRPVEPRQRCYLAFHKPRGFACTRHDPHVAKTIYHLLPKEFHHLAHAGRLDVDSEGLLLLSNDGGWLQVVTHPRHGAVKTYEVQVRGRPLPEDLSAARRGIFDEGERLKVESVEVLRGGQDSSRLKVVLREGRNREIRRIFRALQHPVVRLKRVMIGSLKLGDLEVGGWRRLTGREITAFHRQPA